MTMTSSSTLSNENSEWLYFVAGALLPSLWLWLSRGSTATTTTTTSDDDDAGDEDMEGVTSGGASSKWG